MAICPICGAEAKPRSENPCFPFCNARCKTVDLGKWINEEYRVPSPTDENDSSEDEDSADEIVRH